MVPTMGDPHGRNVLARDCGGRFDNAARCPVHGRMAGRECQVMVRYGSALAPRVTWEQKSALAFDRRTGCRHERHISASGTPLNCGIIEIEHLLSL